MRSGRRLIVSNRLPVWARIGASGVTLQPAGGGLATALRPQDERPASLWIGGSVDATSANDTGCMAGEVAFAAAGMVPVHLCRDHVDRYYHGFASRVLWPLFHDVIDRLPGACGRLGCLQPG